MLQQDRLKYFKSHAPYGTSFKNLNHMGQLLTSGKFQFFDYGWEKNLKLYGQEDPKEVDISNFDVPVAMFVGKLDTLATLKDNLVAKKKIKNLDSFNVYNINHMCFSMGADMSYIDDVLKVLDKYSKSEYNKWF